MIEISGSINFKNSGVKKFIVCRRFNISSKLIQVDLIESQSCVLSIGYNNFSTLNYKVVLPFLLIYHEQKKPTNI